MLIYAESSIKSKAIERISIALKKYAPKDLNFTEKKDLADLIILYVN